MSNAEIKTSLGTRRWERLSQALDQDGAAGLAIWLKEWFYWNTDRGRRYLEKGGWQPKKYGINSPIVVYQMGKVGSNTIYHSFMKLELDVPVYHAHYLNDLDAIEQETRRVMRNVDHALENVTRAREVLQVMAQRKYPRWHFISMVRVPIPRVISMFFQNLDTFFPDALARYQAGTLKLDELTDFVIHRLEDRFMLEWFDKQLKEPFGIDVFATPFDKARGYQIYRGRKIRLLLIRAKDLNRVAAPAMKEFLRLDDFQLAHRNIGKEKPTGELYSEFMKNLRLPRTMIDRWHNTRYAQHFYTPEELEASVADWV